MNDGQSVNVDLTQWAVVYLVWSAYSNGEVLDSLYNINPLPVPFVLAHQGKHISLTMQSAEGVARKIIYPSSNRISGAAFNGSDALSKMFVLREVWGIK